MKLRKFFDRRPTPASSSVPLPEPPVLTSVVSKPDSITSDRQIDAAAPVSQPKAEPEQQAMDLSANEKADLPAPMRPDLLMTPYLEQSDIAVSFANPQLPDEPLIDVNDAFCRLSGYDAIAALNRNCRFLQGELTPQSEPAAIRQGIKGDYYLITRLLNYRSNGDIFDNVLQLGQVRDTGGHTRFLFGIQWDVTRTAHMLGGSSMEADIVNRELTPQLQQLGRLANHLVRRSDSLGVGAAGVPMVERLAAMSRPYQFPAQSPIRDRATLRVLLDYLLAPHAGDPQSRLRINGTDGNFDINIIGPLALWLHELASGSRQYGAMAEPTGLVVLSWRYVSRSSQSMIEFHWQEVKFAALPGADIIDPEAPVNRTGGTGAQVIRDVVEFAGGRTAIRAWDGKLESRLLLPNNSI